MKRSSYRGEHKGSTLKARSKIWSSRVLNSVLAVVLVVGLAPSMSFAGQEDPVETPAPQEEPQEPAAPAEESEQQSDEAALQVEVQPASVEESPVISEAEIPAQNQNAAKDGADVQKNEGVSMKAANTAVNGSQGVTVQLQAPNSAKQKDDYTYFVQGESTFTLVVARDNASQSVMVKLDGTEVSPQPTPFDPEGDSSGETIVGLTYTIPIAAAEAGSEVSHQISVKVDTIEDTPQNLFDKTFTVIVDNHKPEIQSVEWASSGADGIIAVPESGNTFQFYVRSGQQNNTTTTATVKIAEKYLPEAAPTITTIGSDGRATFLDGKEATTVAVMESNVQPTASGWTETSEGSGIWQCTLTFKGAGKGQLTIAAVDWAGNVCDSAHEGDEKTFKVDVDNTPPALAMAYAPAGTTVGDTIYYNKTAESFKATATITEDQAGGEFVGKLNGETKFTIDGKTNHTGEIEQAINASTHDNDGSYTITVSGADRVGYELTAAAESNLSVTDGKYEQSIIVDTTDPAITAVKYTGADGEAELESDGTAFAKYDSTADKAIASITVTEANLDKTNSVVKIGETPVDVTWGDTTANVTTGTFELNSSSGEVVDNVLDITIKDIAGNTDATFAGTLVVDRAAPTVAIAWANNPEAGVEDEADSTTYYKSRTATIVVVDPNIDGTTPSNCITVKSTAESGAAAVGADKDNENIVAISDWTASKSDEGLAYNDTYTAKVYFKDNNGKNCTLSVDATDTLGNAAQQTNVSGFSILAHPILEVAIQQDPGQTVNDIAYYALTGNNTLSAKITVKDVDAAEGITAAATNPSLDNAGESAITWEEVTGISREGTVTFSSETDRTASPATTALTITAPKSYVGAADTDSTGGISVVESPTSHATVGAEASTFTISDFVIDKTPPTIISIDYAPEGKNVLYGGIQYFKGSDVADNASAIIAITEHNLNNSSNPKGADLSVNVKESGTDGDGTAFDITPDGETGAYGATATFAKKAGEVAEYTLTISGTDLAGHALVAVDDLSDYMSENTYTSTVVIDDAAPTLTVTYGSGAVFNNCLYKNEEVPVTVSVSDDVFKMDGDTLVGLTISDTAQNGAHETVTDTTVVPKTSFTKNAETGAYEASFTLGGIDSDIVSHHLTITGVDVAGNAMKFSEESVKVGDNKVAVGWLDNGSYEALVYVDKSAPKLTVTGSAAYHQSETLENVPTYYYGKSDGGIRVTASVVDNALISRHGISTSFAKVDGDQAVSFGPDNAGTLYEDTFTINADGTYGLSIAGGDAAGNKLEAAEVEEGVDNLAGDEGAIVEGAFRANMVYDSLNPGVNVTYTVADSSAEPANLAYDGTAIVGNTVTVKATFVEGEDGSGMDPAAENTVFKYKPQDGDEVVATVENGKLTWADDYSYATFEVPVVADATTTYTVTVNGSDMCGNALVGNSTVATSSGTAKAYTATIVIDNTPPELTVTYTKSGAEGSIENVPSATAATADEKRFYNNTATVAIEIDEGAFDPEKITIGGVATTAADWTTSGTKHTYVPGKTYSEEGAATLTIVGEDAYGNKLVSGDEGTFVDETTGTYTSKIIVDKTPPTVEVKYNTANDKASATTLASGGNFISGQDLYVFATVTEPLSFDEALMEESYQILATPDAKIIKNDGKVWTDNGDGTYTATLLLDADADQDQDNFYTVTVTGQDLAGNQLSPYSSTFEIDKQAPKLRVTFNPDPVDTSGSEATLTRYYGKNTTVTATVEVVEMNHELVIGDEGIKLTADNGATVTDLTLKSNEGGAYTYEGTVEMTAPDVENVTHTISVSGADKYGNKLASNDSGNADPYVSSAGAYTSMVCFDVVAPKLTVEWTPATAVNGKYFNVNRTATVKIVESSFNPKRFTLSKSGKDSIASNWSQDGDTWTLTTDFSFTNNKDEQYLVITGTDRANNPIDTTFTDNSSVAGATVASGTYTSSKFVVDTVAPGVTMSLDQGRSNFFNKADYFKDGMWLNVEVAVVDDHFDYAANTAYKADMNDGFKAEGAVRSEGSWDGKTRTVQFAENRAGNTSSSLSVKVYDLAGNSTTYAYGMESGTYSATAPEGGCSTKDSGGKQLTGEKFVLDITAPRIVGGNGSDIPSQKYFNKTSDNAMLFYNSATSLTLVVNDDLGVYSMLAEGGDGLYTFADGEGVEGAQGSTQRTKTVTLTDGHEFTKAFTLSTKDVAGNTRTWAINPGTGEVKDVTGSSKANTPLYGGESSLYPETLIQDSVAPKVTDLSGATAGEFTNSNRTIHAQVEELNFGYMKAYDSGQVILTISKNEGNAGRAASSVTIPVSGFSAIDADAGVYDASYTLSDDGHYSAVAVFTDLAGHTSNTMNIGEFTIDKTAPVIQEITFDNNDSRNGKYYKSGRTATITVIEHNWDPSLFTITTNGSIGGWSDSGDTHTCTVSFTSDGTYNLSVSGSDRAGNAAESRQVEEFVVDLTAPTIDFSNVAGQTAYNAEIAPVINYHDEANFDANGMTWTLTGNKHGAQTFAAGQSSSGNDGTVSFSDFPREVEADDIYTLQAHLTDMAGNEADNSITFSVNRFGSNFIVMDEKTFTEHKGYLAEPIEVRVQEINVSGAQSEMHAASVTHGLTTENLERKSTGTPTSTGFYIESGTDSSGWATYIYHVGSGNFSDEGNYHVVLSSTDTATNLNNSASYYNPEQHKVADAEVSFILDTTDPIIEGISVSDGQTKDAGAERLTFTVTDNIGFDTVKVVVDGEEQTVEPEMGGLCVVDLPAKAFAARDMQIIATDLAGRTAEAAVLGFHWTDNIFELHLPLVLGGLAVIVAAVVGGVFFVRRRNGQ